MAISARPCRSADELRSALDGIFHYFGDRPDDESLERFSQLLPAERMHAALDGDEIVGGAGVFPFELTVPGGPLACAGVTVVGVLPTHRRRGALAAMMRAQLDDVHARGEPIAALWASEETIYGRYGYGLASLAGEIELPRTHAARRDDAPARGAVRLVGDEEAIELFPRVYEGVRLSTPGMLSRSPDWWRLRRLADRPETRRGAGVLERALLELDGAPAGYALYRMKPSFDAGVSTGELIVLEAIAGSPQATRELWRFLLGMDWVATIKASLLPPDHPLFHLLATPRRMRFRVGDALWLRLVDVGAALSGRVYADGPPLVLDVRDAFCPWNEGRWRIEAGEAARTDAEPDLSLDVQALASAYLGGFSFAELARAGRVEEAVPGALRRADALLSGWPKPWCPEIF